MEFNNYTNCNEMAANNAINDTNTAEAPFAARMTSASYGCSVTFDVVIRWPLRVQNE